MKCDRCKRETKEPMNIFTCETTKGRTITIHFCGICLGEFLKDFYFSNNRRNRGYLFDKAIIDFAHELKESED